MISWVGVAMANAIVFNRKEKTYALNYGAVFGFTGWVIEEKTRHPDSMVLRWIIGSG